MSFYLIVLIVFIAGIVQAALLPINWVMVIVLFGALAGKGKKAAWLAFLSGLILDLIVGNRLGLSSLAFLLVAFLVFSGRDRLITHHPAALFLTAFLSELIYNKVLVELSALTKEGLFLFRFWNFPRSLIFGLVFLLVYFCFFREIKKKKGLRLKIK
jgi:rod shape-determining protein MreD